MAVTNASIANIPFWPYLPMMYTNYGGDQQISTIPSYIGYNLGMSFNPAAQATWGNPMINAGQQIPSANVDQGAILRTAQGLLAPALNQLTSQNLNTCINNITAVKARLNSKMQAEGTTEADKAKIQNILEQLKEYEDKLAKIKESSDLDPQTAYQQVSEIESGVNKLVREAITLINGGSASSTTSTTGSTDSTGSTGTTSTTGDTSTPASTSTSTSTTTSPSQGASDNVDDFSTDVKAAVDQFYDAINGWGTDDAKMEEVLNSVNKDNIMDLALGWNKYHSGEKGESFIEAFMWDADASQKKTYGKQIARALRDKAEELGIYDECRADFAAIDKEMGSWFWVSNDVSKNYDNIIAKIAEKMGSSYGRPMSKGES